MNSPAGPSPWSQSKCVRASPVTFRRCVSSRANSSGKGTCCLSLTHAGIRQSSTAGRLSLSKPGCASTTPGGKPIARRNCSRTRLFRPKNPTRVRRALLTEGNYVSGVAGANTLLTTIVSVNPIYVYADIDENSLLKFNALAQARKLETNGAGRLPVELQLADERDFPHRGFIESFDNHLNPNTGSILLRAVFPNADGRVVPGLFARIRVPLSERHPG